VNILFLCAGNSARSILAEAIANSLPASRGRLRAYSAGSHPRGEVHPLALEVLKIRGVSTEGLHSKSWDGFSGLGAPAMDFIITVCDQAAGEACPYWPGQPVTAHWGMPDPAALEDSEEARRRAFADTATVLKRRIELFAALPLETLDRASLQRHAGDIAGA
jgi:arsenate reductase